MCECVCVNIQPCQQSWTHCHLAWRPKIRNILSWWLMDFLLRPNLELSSLLKSPKNPAWCSQANSIFGKYFKYWQSWKFPTSFMTPKKEICFGKPDIINWISCGLASSWLPWLSSLSLKLESTTINYVSTLTLQSMRNTQRTKKQKISKTLDSLPLAHIYRQCTIDFTKRLKIFYVILLI